MYTGYRREPGNVRLQFFAHAAVLLIASPIYAHKD
jgi:hypothetical protein